MAILPTPETGAARLLRSTSGTGAAGAGSAFWRDSNSIEGVWALAVTEMPGSRSAATAAGSTALRGSRIEGLAAGGCISMNGFVVGQKGGGTYRKCMEFNPI